MRNTRLDILRCIAILLVIFQHGQIFDVTNRMGWIGVDLFFVLSGFLISGLLFGEYRRTGSIRLKRFFIRRGLKIYPAFYVCLAATFLLEYRTHQLSTVAQFLHEALFLQSYFTRIWPATWSLAVEEHFYIFLPVLLLALIGLSSDRSDPFKRIPVVFLLFATLCQLSRAFSAFHGQPNWNRVYLATHNRMDSLFFGVLIGYFYHFRLEALQKLMQPAWTRVLVATISAGFLSCAYWFDRNSWFFGAIGYAVIYLGCGGVLLLSLLVREASSGPIGTALAWVGKYSYSIYLWHGPVAAYLVGHIGRVGPYEVFVTFLVESLAVGIFMSMLIEYPVLHLRNRLFPAAQVAVSAD